MSSDLGVKGAAFRRLHAGPGAFLIPNPWDAGSARVLAALGYKALATSSGASAACLGKRDGEITREECLSHVRAIAAATDLPVAGDLENGFGDTPESTAETIRRAAEAGLVGGSIEDATGRPERPLYDFGQAVERIAAAAEAARSLPFHFTLTARSEGFIRGRPDLDETIRRLSAFAQAGADVVFAPGLPDLAAVHAVCAAVTKPVNFMVGIRGKSFSVRELESARVRRISFATSFYRSALAGLISAACEARDRGTFGYLETAVTTPDLNAFLRPPANGAVRAPPPDGRQ
ncbi:MAG: isocitrate lyase/PEP mutase family protein [Opitutaceae bacterium]